MIILISLALISIVSFWIARRIDAFEHEVAGVLCTVIWFVSGIVLIILLIGIPLNRRSVMVDIQKVEACRITVENARSNKYSDLERATILKEIISWNERIVATQYENKNIWDLWIPDEVDQVELIK